MTGNNQGSTSLTRSVLLKIQTETLPTAVGLTPAVYAAVRKPLPILFACALIANAASFVLPISNPANLVLYGGQMPPLGQRFGSYALPSLAAILVTYAMLRWVERESLSGACARRCRAQPDDVGIYGVRADLPLPGEGWEHRADVPLQDAQRAMRMVRARGAQDGFDPASVLVIGFSAGGHLAASLLTGHDETLAPPADALDTTSARPLAGALIYPVIAMTAPYTHALSASTLLGDRPAPALVERRSPALHVTAGTPPVFLVHALDDPAVPYQNSLMMADALTKAGHPPEMHLFAEGGHGFGTGPSNASAGQWLALFAQWAGRL